MFINSFGSHWAYKLHAINGGNTMHLFIAWSAGSEGRTDVKPLRASVAMYFAQCKW